MQPPLSIRSKRSLVSSVSLFQLRTLLLFLFGSIEYSFLGCSIIASGCSTTGGVGPFLSVEVLLPGWNPALQEVWQSLLYCLEFFIRDLQIFLPEQDC